MKSRVIQALSDWMEKEVTTKPYADIHCTVKIHSGEISIIERYTVEKLKPAELNGDTDENRTQ